MSQPAPKPSATPLRAQAPTDMLYTAAATPAAPDALALHTLALQLKKARHAEEKEQQEQQEQPDAALVAQATTVEEVLLSQAAAGGGGAPAPEACPVAVASVADPCGPAAAADAHPVGGALWALGLLPLLGAGGGGGSKELPQLSLERVDYGIQEYVPAVADFNADREGTGARYKVVSVKIDGQNKPVPADWVTITEPDEDSTALFYLNPETGVLTLTQKGQDSASDWGKKFTVTVQASADGARDSRPVSVDFLSMQTIDETKNSNSDGVLADLGSNRSLNNVRYTLVDAVDDATGKSDKKLVSEDPDSTTAIFHLDPLSGVIKLTAEGLLMSCFGKTYSLTVKAVSDVSAGGEKTVEVTIPLPDFTDHLPEFNARGTDLLIQAGSPGRDILLINQGSANFKQMDFIGGQHYLAGDVEGLFVEGLFGKIGDYDKGKEIYFHLEGQTISNSNDVFVEFMRFTGDGTFYGYNLTQNPDGSDAYFRMQDTFGEKTIIGTDCNDLLVGYIDSTGKLVEDNFKGGAGNDLIFSDSTNNSKLGRNAILSGGDGNDLLVGGGGDDQLDGDAGNDVLIGGAGNDVLTGGAGRDTFVFNVAPGEANADQILDFTVGEDRIWLDKSVFSDGQVSYRPFSGELELVYNDQVFARLNPSTGFDTNSTNFIIA